MRPTYTEANRKGFLTWGNLAWTGPHACPRCTGPVDDGPRTKLCETCKSDPARLEAERNRQRVYKRRYRAAKWAGR